MVTNVSETMCGYDIAVRGRKTGRLSAIVRVTEGAVCSLSDEQQQLGEVMTSTGCTYGLLVGQSHVRMLRTMTRCGDPRSVELFLGASESEFFGNPDGRTPSCIPTHCEARVSFVMDWLRNIASNPYAILLSDFGVANLLLQSGFVHVLRDGEVLAAQE